MFPLTPHLPGASRHLLPRGERKIMSAMADRFLIIDDDARLAGMVRDYLGRGGDRVEARGSGAAGLEAVRSAARRGEPFDAVILDIMLPDIDGLEVCRRLRARGRDGDPDAHRPRRGDRPHRRPGDRRRRLSAQAVQSARAAGAAEGDPAPAAGRRRRGRGGAAFRPAAHRPGFAPAQHRRRGRGR